jgi:hypothetical protein
MDIYGLLKQHGDLKKNIILELKPLYKTLEKHPPILYCIYTNHIENIINAYQLIHINQLTDLFKYVHQGGQVVNYFYKEIQPTWLKIAFDATANYPTFVKNFALTVASFGSIR